MNTKTFDKLPDDLCSGDFVFMSPRGSVRGLPWVVEDAPRLFAKPSPVKCEYCGVYSLELKSNCNSCGAGLPLETVPSRLFYNPEAFDFQSLVNLARPGQNIPIKPSFMHDIASAAIMMFPKR